MRRIRLDRIRARLAAEDGMALIMGLGVSLVLTIAGVSVANYTVTNMHAANRSRATQGAAALAEAGLNNALGVLNNSANNPSDPNLLPPRTSSYDGGTVTWSGSFDSATGTWTLTATGRDATLTSVSEPTRTVSAQVHITSSLTAPEPNRAWDYIYSTHTGSTCDETISAKDTIASALYVNGTLCLSSGAAVTAGPVAVKGQVSLSAVDATIGSLTAPINVAHLAGGCKYYTQALDPVCSGAADHIYASSLDHTFPTVTLPTIDWDGWYRNAAPGPMHGCSTSSGAPPVFDNDTTRSNSVATSFSLTPAASYSCSSGAGSISWNASSRTLTVNGTVFIDGSAKVDNGLVNTYTGQGALYLSGTFLVTSSSKLCAKVASTATDCDFAGWDPSSATLIVITNGIGGQVPAGYGVQLSASASFEGGLYATQAIQLNNYVQTKGPILAPSITFGGGVSSYAFPSMTTVPSGTPGAQPSAGGVSPPTNYTGF
jgi:Tfp pilus assembly protein PilX